MGTDHLGPGHFTAEAAEMPHLTDETEYQPIEKPNLRERDHILNAAKIAITSNRDRDYGDATVNFSRIADLWKIILGIEIAPEQVALCMVALKMARLLRTPNHADSWIDICGYAALGGEIASE